ncbi:RNA 2'-phosphotransferase [Jannaschia seosinensis]|uniref:RNA 2'-phosphotransferase n=1 Tax=Jannaschia seosinensis TaxID=313367 RepID=UPI001C928504|nr:RNA 2'-phosphotransferase [Jannaschia seosinensis]
MTRSQQNFQTAGCSIARVRAAQGHSLALDFGLTAAVPPDTLYHGTARHHLDAIFAEGLRPQRRQFVHLSRDVETARIVGARHGKAVVLTVTALPWLPQNRPFCCRKTVSG